MTVRFNATVNVGPEALTITGADTETFGLWFARVILDFYTGPAGRAMPPPHFNHVDVYDRAPF